MISPIFTRINIKILSGVSISILIFGISVGFFFIPNFLKKSIISSSLLNPGTENRAIWEKPPIFLTFKITMFNVTNPEEVTKGSKPQLQEVGPYIFEEHLEKYNLIDNETADTVEYDLKKTFFFRPNLSNGLNGQELVTVPNLLMMVAILTLHREGSPTIYIAGKAMDVLFKPKTPFITAPAIDILFSGVGIDCNHNDFSSKMVCQKLGAEPGAVHKVNDTYYKFSLFGMMNGTSTGRFVAFRGNKNIRDVGKLISYNGKPDIGKWEGDKCNELKGTDGTFFPPFNKPTDGFLSFSSGFCRTMQTKFVKKSNYDGIPTSFHTTGFGDIPNEPENHCYCQEGDHEQCPPKGTIDLQPCNGGPFLISKAHFIDADPQMAKNVDGLHPNRSIHDFQIHFEPLTGRTLSAKNRIQLNIDMEAVDSYQLMSNLPKLAFPVYWVSEEFGLNSTFTKIFKNGLFMAMTINSSIKWTCILVGVSGIALTVYIYNGKQSQNKIKVMEIVSADNQEQKPTKNEEKTLY